MPIFNFECSNCKNVIETVESYTNSELQHICNTCMEPMKKLLNTASVTGGDTPKFYAR